RRWVGRSYPITSSAVRTAARVASEIPGLPLSTRLTVAWLTPACLATSARLRATLQLYDTPVQLLRRTNRRPGVVHRKGALLNSARTRHTTTSTCHDLFGSRVVSPAHEQRASSGRSDRLRRPGGSGAV